MKVLLIYPSAIYKKVPEASWIPIGLCSIAAVLKENGHAVKIFDRYSQQAELRAGRDELDDAMLQYINNFKPDIIGLSTVSPIIYDTVICAQKIRKIFKGMLIAGGYHATAMPRATLLKIPELDGLIEGEGEYALLRLMEGDSPENVPGVWWKRNGEIKHTPPEQIQSLDDLPFPEYSLLDMDFYCRPSLMSINGHYISSFSVLTSRGCQYKCDFCAESLTYGKGIRSNSPEYVVEFLLKLINKYKIKGIYFQDNDFLADEDRAQKLCRMFIDYGINKRIKWVIQTRTERINTDILKLLKQAGCIKIEMGVEAAAQGQLDIVHKASTVDINERAIKLCKKEGILSHAYMITSFEGENINELEDRLNWVKRMKPDTFMWSQLMLHPGTLLYKKRGKSFFENNSWSEENIKRYYSTDTLSNISEEERRKWMRINYNPYSKWNRRKYILRVNTPYSLLLLVYKKLSGLQGNK